MIEETFNTGLLTSKGFKLIDNEGSALFGDYFEIYSNDETMIRFSCDRLFKNVDIASVLYKGRWYDLSLIKAIINNEQDLLQTTTVKDYNDFLENNLSDIKNLLSKQNYFLTIKTLEVLENKRAKQMFPNR